jgi:hypothetical protein
MIRSIRTAEIIAIHSQADKRSVHLSPVNKQRFLSSARKVGEFLPLFGRRTGEIVCVQKKLQDQSMIISHVQIYSPAALSLHPQLDIFSCRSETPGITVLTVLVCRDIKFRHCASATFRSTFGKTACRNCIPKLTYGLERAKNASLRPCESREFFVISNSAASDHSIEVNDRL